MTRAAWRFGLFGISKHSKLNIRVQEKAGSPPPKNVFRVLHVAPYDGIGGVETAIRSMSNLQYGCIEFRRFYLAGAEPDPASNIVTGRAQSISSPYSLWKAASRIREHKPDLIIASLWRGVATALMSKLIRPSIPVVVFLHFPRHVHSLDAIVNWIGMFLSVQIWTDSDVTLHQRVPSRFRCKARAVSFLIERLSANQAEQPVPIFAFWGRLHPQKGLDRSLELFARVVERVPESRFIVIGPDAGEQSRLKAFVEKLGLTKHVEFSGGLTLAQIRAKVKHASFYLQTSLLEGMAISVVEAMQMGLLPIVTPVGEIGTYARDGINSIHVVGQDDDTVGRICDILSDRAAYARLRHAALQTWSNARLYREDVITRCLEIAGCPHPPN